MEETRKRFTVKDVLIRLILVIVFIFLLIWLFPMPDVKPLNNQLFSQNVNAMKEVAKTYYTIERLPNKINGKVKMTLQEMLDKKLAFPLMDSKGNYCDTEESYIEITKLENEYTIKVNLSCSDKEDYLIEHYGCYDICSDKCHPTTTKKIVTTPKKPKTTEKVVYEYLHKRVSYKEVFDKYVCNINGYTLVGDKCIKKDSKIVKVDAKEKTETKTIVDKKYAEVKLNYEDKEVPANLETKTETITTYVCPTGTTEIAGTNKCSKPTSVIVNKICPTGYVSASATTCKKDNISVANKICPTGYTSASATTCKKTVTTTVNKVCPSGYTSVSSTKCSKTTIADYVDKEFYWKYVGTVDFANKVAQNQNINGVMYKNGRPYITYECDTCYSPTVRYIYDKYVYTAKACPTGYVSVSSTKCGKKVTTTANKICPTGTVSISATTCKKTTTTTANKICPTGYTSATATTCNKTTTTTANKICPTGTVAASTITCSKPSSVIVDKDPKTTTVTKTIYVCPIGSTPTSNERICNTKEAKITYICPTGYNPTSNKLICSKTTTQTIVVKYCSDDSYTLCNNYCIKTVNSSDTKDADKKYKKVSHEEYKWSDKKYLDGWTYTNKKRIK